MTTASNLSVIWGNKPGCSRAVAEFWIGREYLWFTLFIDDADARLKIELMPSQVQNATLIIDFTKAETLIESAKRDLLAMSVSSEQHSSATDE